VHQQILDQIMEANLRYDPRFCCGCPVATIEGARAFGGDPPPAQPDASGRKAP
jgi:hypothetical protein